MQDHSVDSAFIFHDIPDMTDAPLRKLILCLAARRLASPEDAAILEGVDAENDSLAVATLARIFSAPRSDLPFIEGLQWMGAAFTQAYGLNTAPPENLSQSQWNRALRDQGERLRAASLTLGAGREQIAAEQLAPLVQFIEKHFADLPA